MTICQQDSQNHSCCHAPLKPVYSPRPGTFLNAGPEEHLGAGARTGFSLPETISETLPVQMPESVSAEGGFRRPLSRTRRQPVKHLQLQRWRPPQRAAALLQPRPSRWS